MRILFVGRNCQVGGGATFRLRTSMGLIGCGHQVLLAAQGGTLKSRFQHEGVEVHTLPPTPFNRLPLTSLIKKGGFDVVHACNSTAGDDVASTMRKLGAKAPAWVMSVHGNLPEYVQGNVCLHEAGEMMTFDQSSLKQLNEIPWMRERHVHMMPRLVEKRDLQVGPIAPPHLVMASRLSKTKGRAALAAIEAVKRLHGCFPGLALSIFGDAGTRDEILAQDKTLNDRLGREAIKAPGSVTDPFTAMAEASAVIGTSYVALEALFHAIPVAAGYEGYGTITASNLDDSVACNFGDGFPGIQPIVTADRMESELGGALSHYSTPAGRDELSQIRSQFEAEYALDVVAGKLETIYRFALVGHKLPKP